MTQAEKFQPNKDKQVKQLHCVNKTDCTRANANKNELQNSFFMSTILFAVHLTTNSNIILSKATKNETNKLSILLLQFIDQIKTRVAIDWKSKKY